MPRTGSALGDCTQIRRLGDSCPSPTLPASTYENAEEGTVQTAVVADRAVPAVTEQLEQPD